MKRKISKKVVAKFLAMALVLGGVTFQPAVALHAANETSENKENHWETYGGKSFWYENGVKQGTEADEKALVADGTVRGREICDPAILDEKGNGTWFWLDADPKYDGAKACNKEVYMPYIYQNEKDFDDEEIKRNAAESGDMAAQVERAICAAKDGGTDTSAIGKWVRYDKDGKMVKGWYTVKGDDEKLYPMQAGNTYYYDFKTGLMAKGKVEIDGEEYRFDETTGALVEGKAPTEGAGTSTGSGTGSQTESGATESAGTSTGSGTGSQTESGATESDTAEGTDVEKTKAIPVKGIRYDYNDDGSLSARSEFKYDDAGNKTRETRYTADGSVCFWAESEYDAGNCVKTTEYSPYGICNRYEYEYDNAGNCTKMIKYDADDYIDDWYEYEYDDMGNKVKEVRRWADGSVWYRYEWEYDDAGNSTKATGYNADGSVWNRSEWEYDGAGNKTKATAYNAFGKVTGWYEYKYDSAGNNTREIRHTAAGSVSVWDEFEYDGTGNLTKQTRHDGYGKVGYRLEYEYDGAGNLTKETKYKANGSVEYKYEYEYKTITVQ